MTDLKKTILLVSADRTATGSLEKLLELNGYRAWVSTTLAASLSEIRRRPPMLILLDRQILATEEDAGISFLLRSPSSCCSRSTNPAVRMNASPSWTPASTSSFVLPIPGNSWRIFGRSFVDTTCHRRLHPFFASKGSRWISPAMR